MKSRTFFLSGSLLLGLGLAVLLLAQFGLSPAVPVAVASEPTGMIMGVIVDEGGGPITEAWIQAMPANGEPWGRGTDGIDSTGAYTITDLPPGPYKVEVYAMGYDSEFYNDQPDWMFADDVLVAAGQTTPDINFILTPEAGGAIMGTVVLPDGSPVPDAWVSAGSMENMLWKGAPTDPSGDFRVTGITPGLWRVQAWPPDSPAYLDYGESDEYFIDVVDGITPTLVITLPTVNVIGRVLMPDSTPAQYVPVSIEKVDYSFFTGAGTDYDGYFRKGGLGPGDYRLKLETPWGVSGVVPPEPVYFTITDPGVIVDLGDIMYDTAVKHIQGRVVYEDGAGVANVEVNAWRWGADGWAFTQTDASGNFNLDVSPGTWEVMIHPSPGAQDVDWVYMGYPEKVTFDEPDDVEETKTVNFEVEAANARITGQVLGPNGEQLQPWSAWIDIRDDEGRGNGTSVAPDGSFSIAVAAGTYNVWVGVDEFNYPDWSSPRLAPVTIGPDDVVDLGTIYLIEKTSAIAGQVTREGGGGVAGVWVHAWQYEGGWGSAMTDSDGNYYMSVLSGTWEIDVEPPYTSTYVTGQPPQRVFVDDNEVKTNINFVLQEADGIIEGALYDPSGNPLTDIDGGWAYARQGNSPEPIAGAPVDDGRFTLLVPSGTYNVGVWLPPNSGYSLANEVPVGPLQMAETVAAADTPGKVAALDMSAGEKLAAVQAGTTVTVNLTLLPNDSRIIGTFYLDDARTIPAVGLVGEVFAVQEMGSGWQSAPIDPATGSYELWVPAGTWNLGYWLMSSGYVNNPPPDTRVTIGANDEFIFNFTAVVADATIEGVVLEPDGVTPFNHAWAWAHRQRIEGVSARIDTGDDSKPPYGFFSIDVPSGGQYEVGAYAPEEWGFIQPDTQIVTPTSGATEFVTLQFKESDATIEGTVYLHDNAGNVSPATWAWVWAWSDDGQHAGAVTDFNGEYQLNVLMGTTWHIGAVYEVAEGLTFYETNSPTDIVMDAPLKTADLDMYLSDVTLPPAVAATFDPAVGWSHTLEDGTRIEIPAGAMPTTDTVRISITPLLEELPNTLTSRPFGFGYAIAVYEESSGNQIVQNFNANVLITFYYTEDELQKRGVTEETLSPAYFSTTTNSWTKVAGFTVNEATNKVTSQVNHFSTWALTSGQSGGAGSVYLPVIINQ